MRTYPVRTPKIVQNVFNKYTWRFPTLNKEVYLTFDDGPIPDITPWVLRQLSQYNAKATFFCIGENVEKNSKIFDRIISEKHTIGNHTQTHLNGWKTDTKSYLEDFDKATRILDSSIGGRNRVKLFRPPYGRIKRNQGAEILKKGFQIVMWDVLSGDFDKTINPEKCLNNVTKNVKNGSIIVFHDSEKSFKNLKFVLPKVLEYLDKKGFVFRTIPNIDRNAVLKRIVEPS